MQRTQKKLGKLKDKASIHEKQPLQTTSTKHRIQQKNLQQEMQMLLWAIRATIFKLDESLSLSFLRIHKHLFLLSVKSLKNTTT